MPTEPLALASRLGVLALATLSLSCQGSDNPLVSTPPPAGNAPPTIVTMKVDPAAIDRDGTALVQVVATDPDGDGVTFAFTTLHGKCVADQATLGRASYVHDGTEALEDLITVAVTDARGAEVKRSIAIEIRPPVLVPTPAPVVLKWSAWLNRDNPLGNGDWETRADFAVSALGCANPVAIEGVAFETYNGTAINPPKPWNATGQVVKASPQVGLYCINADQTNKQCHDYRVRFGCPQ